MITTAPEAVAALAAALAAVQAELPEVKKNRTADVTNKEGRYLYSYSYADLADASAAIMPVLGRHGLSFTSFPGHQPDGKFGLRYWLLHEAGGSIEGFFEIGDQGGMQMVGGRITYARRYCLCAVTGIAAEDDVDAREDGNGNGNGRKAQRRQQPAADKGEQQQPQGTAQRRTRASGSTAARGASSQQQERDDTFPPLPPLPGEEEAPPGPVPKGQPAGNGPAPGPVGPEQPGSITPPQLAKLAIQFTETGYARTERAEKLAAAAAIIGRPLESSKALSLHEASAVIDTLIGVARIATQRGGTPREVLEHLLSDVRAVALREFDRIGITSGEGIVNYAGQLLNISQPPSLESLAALEATRLAVLLAQCTDRTALDALLADGGVPGE